MKNWRETVVSGWFYNVLLGLCAAKNFEHSLQMNLFKLSRLYCRAAVLSLLVTIDHFLFSLCLHGPQDLKLKLLNIYKFVILLKKIVCKLIKIYKLIMVKHAKTELLGTKETFYTDFHINRYNCVVLLLSGL